MSFPLTLPTHLPTQEFVVSWCTMVCCARKSFSTSLTFIICQSGYGTRVIPPGSIKGAHFVQTPDYVQITGIGDLTSMNIPAGDAGGELDPHGATGNGSSLGPYVLPFTILLNLGSRQPHRRLGLLQCIQ